MRAAGGAAMAGAIPTGLSGQAAREPSTAAFQQSVARWCFSDIPLETFCRELVDLQLPAIDLLTPEEWPVALDHGLVVSTADVAAGTIEDGLNDPANHDTIVEAFREWLPRAREGRDPQCDLLLRESARYGRRGGDSQFDRLSRAVQGASPKTKG